MAIDGGTQQQSHKIHRSHQVGASAKKKSKPNKKRRIPPTATAGTDSDGDVDKENKVQRNPKVKAKRLQARATEKEQKRLHVPVMDRSAGEPAPFVIVVQGPPQVGKSLVIKSLVKHYTKHNLPEVRGPITIVSGKAVVQNQIPEGSNQVPKELRYWNGITSKRKGQKWGTERNSFSRRSNSKDIDREVPKTLIFPNEIHLDGPINFQKLPILSDLPKVGDVIGYRLLELSSSWIPELSPFRVGHVSWSNVKSGKLIVRQIPIINPKARNQGKHDGGSPARHVHFGQHGSDPQQEQGRQNVGQQGQPQQRASSLRVTAARKTRPIAWLIEAFCALFWIIVIVGGLVVLIIYLV